MLIHVDSIKLSSVLEFCVVLRSESLSLAAFYLTVPLALTEFPRARRRLHWHCFLSETQGLRPRAPRSYGWDLSLTSDNPEICSMHPFDF